MNTKKTLSAFLAAAMTVSLAAVLAAPTLAATDDGKVILPVADGAYTAAEAATTATGGGLVVSGDTSEPMILVAGNAKPITAAPGSISLDTINPNQTFYIRLGADSPADLSTVSAGGRTVSARDLGDSKLFKMDIKKDGDGKSLIKSITQVQNKSYLTNAARGSYLKVVLNDTTTTTDLKANAKLTFKARKNYNAKDVKAQGTFNTGDTVVLDLNMWVNNSETTGNPETGDRVFYDPDKNDTNVLVWGDDRAAIKFDADSNTSKFYARLSTKNDAALYAKYGDPVNADLWFYDFVSNPTIPSTSRATLTLGIPWEDDDAYLPDPESCFIYQKDANGNLTDVTSLFTYSEDAQEIPGWSMKTRKLGSYILSDASLLKSKSSK